MNVRELCGVVADPAHAGRRPGRYGPDVTVPQTDVMVRRDWLRHAVAAVVAVAFVLLNGLVVTDAFKLGLDALLLVALGSAFALGWRVPVLGIVAAVAATFGLWAATGAFFGSTGETDIAPGGFALNLLGFALLVRGGFRLARRARQRARASASRAAGSG